MAPTAANTLHFASSCLHGTHGVVFSGAAVVDDSYYGYLLLLVVPISELSNISVISHQPELIALKLGLLQRRYWLGERHHHGLLILAGLFPLQGDAPWMVRARETAGFTGRPPASRRPAATSQPELQLSPAPPAANTVALRARTALRGYAGPSNNMGHLQFTTQRSTEPTCQNTSSPTFTLGKILPPVKTFNHMECVIDLGIFTSEETGSRGV